MYNSFQGPSDDQYSTNNGGYPSWSYASTTPMPAPHSSATPPGHGYAYPGHAPAGTPYPPYDPRGDSVANNNMNYPYPHQYSSSMGNYGDTVPHTHPHHGPPPMAMAMAGSPPTSSRHHRPAPSSSHGHNHHNTQIQIPESSPDDDPIPRGPSGRKVCSHCRTTETPLWRRDPRTHKPLCNACGIYMYQRNEARPEALIAVDRAGPELGASAHGFGGQDDGNECTNCGTHKTSSWRRDRSGAQVCNACGVYERMNGRPRPLALRNDKIRPRTKPR